MKLQGKVSVITGGAVGIGGAISMRFAAEGSKVAIVARRLEALEEHAEKIRNEVPGADVLCFSCDVTDEDSVTSTRKAILERFGTVDVLVNSAGVTGPVETPLHELEPGDWDFVLSANVKGTALPCRAFIPSMISQKSGKILNVSGTSGLRGYINRAAYSSSKWAVRGLTRTLSLELGPHNINVNAICPGPVFGDRMKRIIERKMELWDSTYEDVYKKYTSEMALGRFADEDDCAESALFLCTEASKNITGQAIAIDCGWDV
jgi:NAD(P)-dependent dehydrogenase (short-subunit alcohol dehydrogenase family)